MKNRIWKKILAVGVSLLAEAGMLVGCTAQPAVAYGAEMEGGLSVAQDAAWTDLQKFQAVISVKADGLASLTRENENQEYESDDENLFSSGNQDGSLENDQYDFSDETIPHPTSYELVVWLSEYFQPDASFMAPEGCLKEELPIETADGRSSSITGFRWKINPGEQGKQLKIPVTLRDEYRFPAEKHTVPTCQDILHANGAISGEENGGGVYIVKKVENEKTILCKALSKNLEIPAAHMDFSVEMEAKEKALYTGKRIHMAVNLTNNGQVPFYKISLQAKVKEQELVPGSEEWPMITGYGSEAQAVKDVAEEELSFTTFMDRKELAQGGAQMAIDYLTGEKVDVKDYSQYDNGVKIVGTFTCTAQIIDKDNYQILIDNGTYTEDEIKPDPTPTPTPVPETTSVPQVTEAPEDVQTSSAAEKLTENEQACVTPQPTQTSETSVSEQPTSTPAARVTLKQS